MRFALPFAMSVLACSGTEGMPSNPLTAPATEVHPSSTIPRADVEHDLALVLRRTTTEGLEPDHNPQFALVLTNRSPTTSYPVVLSNDGSEAGWREPHVWYSLEVRSRADEPWRTPPELRFGRCGMYARDWAKDVVTIAPGQEIVLPWADFFHKWDLDGATHARIVGHYAYGDHAKDLRKVPPSLHAMPPYALATDPLEVAIETPMTLELRVKGALPTGPRMPLAPAIEIFAVNRSRTPLPFVTADKGSSLRLEVEATETDGSTSSHIIETSVSVDDAKERLAPGARRSVVGAAKTLDWTQLPASARPKRVRAVLNLWWYTDEATSQSDSRIARSPWVDLP